MLGDLIFDEDDGAKEEEVILPNAGDIPAVKASLHLRMLATLKDSSDHATSIALGLLEEACGKHCGRKNVNAAYNDPALAGGGVKSLQQKLHRVLAYCPNPESAHGKLKCGRACFLKATKENAQTAGPLQVAKLMISLQS